MKEDLALVAQHVEDQVALANRAAAREHEDVVREAFIHCPGQIGDRVGGRAVRHGHAAVIGDDGREREPVDVVDLPGRERLARIDNLVARREDRDARARVDLDVAKAQRGKRADAAGIQHLAGAHDRLAGLDVGALPSDVLPRFSGCEDADL